MTSVPTQLRGLIGSEWKDGRGRRSPPPSPRGPTSSWAREHWPLLRTSTKRSRPRAAGRGWSRTPQHERAQVLIGVADSLERNASALGRELAAEEGKTAAEGLAEVRRAAQVLRYCAGEAERDAGEIYNSPRRGERILVPGDRSGSSP